MIIVKLMGGLGNQMFQYAAARCLCAMSKNKLRVDLNFLRKYNKSTIFFTAREYELHIFKKARIKTVHNRTLDIFFKTTFFYRLLRKISYPRRKIIDHFSCELPVVPANTKNIYLNGYFQSEIFFRSIRTTILSDFTFPEPDTKNSILLRQIESVDNSVSIHIRRGDYTKPEIKEFHGILPLIYYETAIRDLSGRIPDNLHFFIFSDDPVWVKLNFTLDNSRIIDGNTGKDSWKDMALMAHCKHHIVANSSFSWWGAWLSVKNGINYAPAHWFNAKKTNYSINDIVPRGWKIVDYE